MANFQEMIIALESTGLSDVLIPFLLVFTIVFAALRQTKILGDEKKFHVIIAMVMAFAVVIPHVLGRYPPGKDVVVMMNTALPHVSIVLVAILMVLIMLGVFGFEFAGGGYVSGGIFLLAIVAVGAIFGNAAGWFRLPGWLSFINEPATRSLIIIVLIFGIIIAFITREDSAESGGMGKVFENFGKGIRRVGK